jgi:hypothetical protein
MILKIYLGIFIFLFQITWYACSSLYFSTRSSSTRCTFIQDSLVMRSGRPSAALATSSASTSSDLWFFHSSLDLVLLFTLSLFYTHTHGHLSEGEVERLDAHLDLSVTNCMYLWEKNFFSKLQCGLNTDEFYLVRDCLLRWCDNLSRHPHLCCVLLWLLQIEEFLRKNGNLFGDLCYSLTRIRTNWSMILKISGISIQDLSRILSHLDDMLMNFHLPSRHNLRFNLRTVFLD